MSLSELGVSGVYVENKLGCGVVGWAMGHVITRLAPERVEPIPMANSHAPIHYLNTHVSSFFEDPTLMSRYILMWSLPIHPPVKLVWRQMLWSPGSCEVKVKRPSWGPRVLTTTLPLVRSWACEHKVDYQGMQ